MLSGEIYLCLRFEVSEFRTFFSNYNVRLYPVSSRAPLCPTFSKVYQFLYKPCKVVSTFIATIVWKKFLDVCIDVSQTMFWSRSEFIAKIKAKPQSGWISFCDSPRGSELQDFTFCHER